MSTVKYIQDMVTRFRVILDAHDKHLECFCRYGVQVEGWLKGELLNFLMSRKLMADCLILIGNADMTLEGRRLITI